jgi:hypothetical protein
MNTVLGGLEMVGGIGIDALTAGTLGNPLIGLGAKTLGGGSSSGATMPGTSGSPMDISSLMKIFQKSAAPDLSGSSMSPTGGMANMNAIQQIIASMQNSGGNVWNENLGFPSGDGSPLGGFGGWDNSGFPVLH